MKIPPPFFPSYDNRRAAFTLVELLAVLGIILLMTALIVPAFTGLKGAGDVSKVVYNVAGILDQARAYAMGNNTYVYVGFQEVDVAQADTIKPQVSGVGRVALAVFASKDGTSSPPPTVPTASNLTSLQKLQHFENMHLADFTNITATSGGMTERQPIATTTASLGNAAADLATGVAWPLGSSGADTQYTFQKIIQFSPQGVATLLNNATIQPWVEIALQQTRGNLSPTPPSGTILSSTNLAAIQIDGVIGSSRIYRP